MYIYIYSYVLYMYIYLYVCMEKPFKFLSNFTIKDLNLKYHPTTGVWMDGSKNFDSVDHWLIFLCLCFSFNAKMIHDARVDSERNHLCFITYEWCRQGPGRGSATRLMFVKLTPSFNNLPHPDDDRIG